MWLGKTNSFEGTGLFWINIMSWYMRRAKFSLSENTRHTFVFTACVSVRNRSYIVHGILNKWHKTKQTLSLIFNIKTCWNQWELQENIKKLGGHKLTGDASRWMQDLIQCLTMNIAHSFVVQTLFKNTHSGARSVLICSQESLLVSKEYLLGQSSVWCGWAFSSCIFYTDQCSSSHDRKTLLS